MSRSWQPSPPYLPTQGQIAAILAMRDPVLRNLAITQTYRELTLALASVLGSENIAWCGYATWASKTAGQFIRGELLNQALTLIARRNPGLRGLHQRRIRLLQPGLVNPPRMRVVQQVQAHVAEGNLLVFTDLAPLYVDLVELLRASPRPTAAQREAFLARFVPGPVERGGQDMLRRAFEAYIEIGLLLTGKQKAERMLLANALIGYHEQTRLQGPIEGALRAPLLLLRPLGPAGARTPRLASRRAAHVTRLGQSLSSLSTRYLMCLELPEGPLRLGVDIPPLPSSGQMFPDELRSIADPELCALLSKLDRTPNTTLGSAAWDWSDLGDRMNFVVDLFRSRQQDPSLLVRAPFTDEQVASLRAGQLPRGPL